MKGVKEQMTSLAVVDQKIEALLAKDELNSEESKTLTDLDQEAADLKSKIAETKARDKETAEIKAKLEERKLDLLEPQEKIETPLLARSEGLRPRQLDDPKSGFARYDDFAKSVFKATKPGASIDERLLNLNAAYGNNSDDGADGGFLVPVEYSNRIFERLREDLPIVEQCDKLTLSGNSVVVNGMSDHDQNSSTYRHGGVVVYWVGEGAQITRSSLKFRQIALRLHKLAALSYVTEDELQDVSNFGSRLLDKQALGIRDEVIEAIMFGTGVGQPLGAFVGTAPCVQVAKETGQSADTIVAENIINMNSVIWSPSRSRGQWYYNGECLPQLEAMSIAVGTGGVPAYWPASGLAAASPAAIKGRPAFETDHCSALGDAGDVTFADWSQYLLAMKGTVDTAMSIHLRFDYAETAFRSMFRIDGRPAWDTNLKPRKGASARRVSPFVKLAERA